MVTYKNAYRTPVRYANASVSLDEFTDEELRAEMDYRRRNAINHTGADEDVTYLPEDLISRLSTLRLCGQRESALRELCDYLEPIVGRLLP